ncbi:sirohydrochlorin ferrochelatase [Bacillus sp. FJAT-27231]|uniref:sirohydrochlorin chelatase n=1 Tax=Bacillus sp. FJAT-27231 TaxID=1679168 RepID=UPI0006714C4D|nr:sirohydrochlorin chelatase [Bacillus sp. FJAT-27231]KMY53975.1 sirohydrochlorin ferrochelatase [Bacillus sp. FJAT-27231]
MKAVLYICHGSRVKKGRDEAFAFIERAKPFIDIPIQEACFLELAEPTIEQGVSRCVAQGATEIIVFPFLLLAAGHAKKDIPVELEKVQFAFPSVVFHYAKPLGVHEAMVDILVERMKETGQPIMPDASVLIVGRGSSDPQTKEDFAAIRDLFRNKTKLLDVNIGYLAAAAPSFKEELVRIHQQMPVQLWVLPYLLFTGILSKTMEKEIRSLDSQESIILTKCLGYHSSIRNIMKERIREADPTGGHHYVSHHG